ncbi:uncharacterized protein BO66DRAFT_414895 [Aspergillus aculeatinus CBS 121060]|uniref:Uncharacterized protein n=1 Tax=Aspergillus aculeatinus CBS 121060 TaxID=1448322 RepID=A0ACD1GX86_9EURO|nr:hypothetical protein BO66DRAFT_414895 [Aspergillus aculeatinus CBS 121060]RAH65795.1 hypothetical protein BO66DRAFT_414895 [Aspergillus aculeatinus CBS 121060]
MQQALERFRVRMATANRKFIQDRVDEIEARGLANEEVKWQKMVEYRHIYLPNEREENEFPPRLVDLPAALDTDVDNLEAREQFPDMLQQVFQQQAAGWAAERGQEAPQPPGLADDLEVTAGVVTGTGYIGEHPHWYSAYLYCRQRDDAIPDAPNIRNWAWRVVVLDDKGDFWDWYCSWPDYLDARRIRSLRRRAVQCETDCESDCDLHLA